METAPLLKQVTHYRGHLWFRAMVDNVCFCIKMAEAKLAIKHLHAVLKVTKPKSIVHGFGPFDVQIDTVSHIKMPLAFADFVEQKVPVDRDWLIAIKPLLERAVEIVAMRGGSYDFTLAYDGDDPVEVELDRKSIPPQKG